MLSDNLTDALAELRALADPRPLAEATLVATAEAMVEHDSETVSGEYHRGDWRNRSHALEDSYEVTDVERAGDVFSVEEVNVAEHAVYVEAIDGLSVLTASDSGAWKGMMDEAFEDAKRAQERAAAGPTGSR